MKVCWGKVLVGAAVAAGAMAAFVVAEPFLQESIIPAIEKLAGSLGETVAKAWAWLGANVIGSHSAEASKGIVGFIMDNKVLSIGSAATAGALIAMRAHNGHALPQEMETAVQPGFAAREDMRRMQALMQARAGAGVARA